MPFYPDWVAALDDVAKGEVGAVVTQRNAQDIIREIEMMQAELKLLRVPLTKS